MIWLPEWIFKHWECFIECIVLNKALAPKELQLFLTQYAPKTHCSIPLNKTTAAAVPTQWGRWATQITEMIPLDHMMRHAASSVHCPCAAKGKTSDLSDWTIETYPPQFITLESDESDEEPNTIANNDPTSDVSLLFSSYSNKCVHDIIDTNGPMALETQKIS
jgi:hypothetical protein